MRTGKATLIAVTAWAIATLAGCVSAPLYTSKPPLRHDPAPASVVHTPPAQGQGSAWIDEPEKSPSPAPSPVVTASIIPLPVKPEETTQPEEPSERSRERVVETFRGEASYYAREFHGRKTASGERFDMRDLTAAHRTLAFGTRVRVINADNGLNVVVRVNDRGPFKRGRVIDVSYAAAQKLGMLGPGTIRVKCEVLEEPSRR